MSKLQDNLDSSLESLSNEGLIRDVLHVVKSGKEATVLCCLAGPAMRERELLAAKVYKPRALRNFRDDAGYREGKDLAMGRRDRLAMHKKSRHGLEVSFGSWIAAEYATLRTLHALGADVPEPFGCSSGALLMEYFGDREGGAPMLSEVALAPPQALEVFRRIIRNVALWLSCHLVHGDLSAFNVLYWEGNATVIDFPQAVDPRFNHQAHELLRRDLGNLCRHFRRAGVEADADRIADELWYRYRRAEL